MLGLKEMRGNGQMKEYIEYCTGCGLCYSVKGIKLN